MESLDKLKGLVKERIAREHGGMSRQKLKRQLLDQLDTMHKFAPPPTLIEDEFNQRVERHRKRPQATGAHLRR